MKIFLEWLKPGIKVKRYIILQLISIGTLAYSVISLTTRTTLTPKILVAYIALITLSLFLTIYSFLLAQRNVLRITLKNLAYKEKNIDIRRLLYTDAMLKKGAKVVVIGGGKGLPNILGGLKEFTSNITLILNMLDEDDDSKVSMDDVLTPGDIRRDIIALSPAEAEMEQLFSYKADEGKLDNHSLGSLVMDSMINTMEGLSKASMKMSEIFNLRGKMLPITMDKTRLCAGLENGEIVVGGNNIKSRVLESRSRIKQVFLKDTQANPTSGVIESIREADVIVLGPGNLYTSVICNLLVNDVAKAIVQSKAKKIMIANLMNEPGETSGYTLAKHVNEVERYLGKHVLDYVIANNGEITEDMMYDFNQGESNPLVVDLENIQNRTISVIEEDLVVTAPNSILHDNLRVSEIIMEVAKSKGIGKLNLLKPKNRKDKNGFVSKVAANCKKFVNNIKEKKNKSKDNK